MPPDADGPPIEPAGAFELGAESASDEPLVETVLSRARRETAARDLTDLAVVRVFAALAPLGAVLHGLFRRDSHP
jgi:hypothetical protein